MKIEITIPVFNEEASITEKIKELSSYVKENLHELGEFKIIIADNGSTDGTKLKGEALSCEFAGIDYMRIEEKGVGLALKTSWMRSDSDIVGYMDLDLATDLKYIKIALRELIASNADIVTGSRLKPGATVIGRSLLRNITSISFNLLLKIMFQTSFSDGMCGFKFLNRNICENLLSNGACSNGWFFATEILISGEYLGYKVYDLPISWTDDRCSKVKIIPLSLEYIKRIIILKRFLGKKLSNSRIRGKIVE